MNSQSPPSLLLHGMTVVAFVIHIAGGAVGLVSGTIAVFARKGEYLHRKAGTVFVASMLVMAVFAIYLGFAVPDEITNVFIGTFALYLVATAWMTVRRREGASGFFEKSALLVAFCLCAPFAILTFQLAVGLPPLFASAVPFKGPVLIAIYVFTTVLVLAVIGDARVAFAVGLSGVPRIIATSVAHVPRAHAGRWFGIHERIRAAIARSLPRADELLPAAVRAFGLDDILDDPRALRRLAPIVRRSTTLNVSLSGLLDTSHCASSEGWRVQWEIVPGSSSHSTTTAH